MNTQKTQPFLFPPPRETAKTDLSPDCAWVKAHA